MGTTAEKLQYTVKAVDAIQAAITEKGVPVADDVELASYAGKIMKIEDRKPLHNFIERKSYQIIYRKGATYPAQYESEQHNIDGRDKYKMDYGIRETGWAAILLNLNLNAGSPSGPVPDGGRSVAGVSREYLDNFIPKFNGYYLETVLSDDNKYVRLVTLGYSKAGECDGTDFYTRAQVVNGVNLHGITAATQTGFHRIAKLSEDVGLILYYVKTNSSGIAGGQTVRMFRVNRDGTVKLFSGLSAVGGGNATTEYVVRFGNSLHAPNQVMVLLKKVVTNSSKEWVRDEYTCFELSCNTLTSNNAGSTTTGFNQIRTSRTNADGTTTAVNNDFGNTNTYEFFNTDFANDIATFIRVPKAAPQNVVMYSYFGDNRANPLTANPKKTAETLREEGYFFYPDMYIKKRRADGNYVMHTDSGGIETEVIMEATTGLFYEAQEG